MAMSMSTWAQQLEQHLICTCATLPAYILYKIYLATWQVHCPWCHPDTSVLGCSVPIENLNKTTTQNAGISSATADPFMVTLAFLPGIPGAMAFGASPGCVYFDLLIITPSTLLCRPSDNLSSFNLLPVVVPQPAGKALKLLYMRALPKVTAYWHGCTFLW